MFGRIAAFDASAARHDKPARHFPAAARIVATVRYLGMRPEPGPYCDIEPVMDRIGDTVSGYNGLLNFGDMQGGRCAILDQPTLPVTGFMGSIRRQGISTARIAASMSGVRSGEAGSRSARRLIRQATFPCRI